MKLKYYLRGLGMGILFATIIMAISSNVHKNDISDEEIIKRAQKLGMVMSQESEKHDGLWQTTEEAESEVLSENTTVIESENTAGDTQTSVSTESENTAGDTQAPIATESQTASSEDAANSQADSSETSPVYVEITIVNADLARNIAESLEFNGLVVDADSFHKYLADHGYTRRIQSGTFRIPLGASYEEICDIIVSETINEETSRE